MKLRIDGKEIETLEGATLLEAALAAEIYIPSLCRHPDLPPFRDLPLAERVYQGERAFENEPPAADGAIAALEGCGLCVVEVAGEPEPVRACAAPAASGMEVTTSSERLRAIRKERLMAIMARHPHSCVTCAQHEGCSLLDCSSNVPKEERCCAKFHDCELRKVAEHVGLKEETPRYRPEGLPLLKDEPLFARDFNLCIHCSRCVRACNALRGVGALGIVHHGGRLVVGSLAPTLAASGCRFCGACVEVCPTGCLFDKEPGTGDRAAWLVPCRDTCAAGADVPAYVRAVAQGDFREAAALIRESLPLPNILGHICFHHCELKCRRGALGEPIAICALKKAALKEGDAILRETAQAPANATGKRVAVVGAGPAGLSAAYFLRLAGHEVTVFEASSTPGGVPALSIPPYRLPKEVVEQDLEFILRMGVSLKMDTPVPLNENTRDAFVSQGFDAALIAVGLPQSKRIPLKGSDLCGVHWGLEFLQAAKTGAAPPLGRRTVVVGGGNVAMDVAMTALRFSAGRVEVFCLESRTEMPAHDFEIAKAEAEGISIRPGWGPTQIGGAGKNVAYVAFRRCTSVFDDRGKFAPTFDDEETVVAEANSVILAVGQSPPDDLPKEGGGLFLAGDASGAPASVVDAVASGRAAAERIDRRLGGTGDLHVSLARHEPPPHRIGRVEEFAAKPRVPIALADPADRCHDFREIEGTYTVEQAETEARRCLQCDLRLLLTPPARPPEAWLAFDETNAGKAPETEGVLILAGEDRVPVLIKGTDNLQKTLREQLSSAAEARFFQWEEDRMFTQRESELIQQHMKRHGGLPGHGKDELDDLF